ncbi:MAG TPA: hypothetical protein VJB99_00095 [Patescibacteria group bacterium]|nr:hypothetical protein [Patescibacteria group bacterium]
MTTFLMQRLAPFHDLLALALRLMCEHRVNPRDPEVVAALNFVFEAAEGAIPIDVPSYREAYPGKTSALEVEIGLLMSAGKIRENLTVAALQPLIGDLKEDNGFGRREKGGWLNRVSWSLPRFLRDLYELCPEGQDDVQYRADVIRLFLPVAGTVLEGEMLLACLNPKERKDFQREFLEAFPEVDKNHPWCSMGLKGYAFRLFLLGTKVEVIREEMWAWKQRAEEANEIDGERWGTKNQQIAGITVRSCHPRAGFFALQQGVDVAVVFNPRTRRLAVLSRIGSSFSVTEFQEKLRRAWGGNLEIRNGVLIAENMEERDVVRVERMIGRQKPFVDSGSQRSGWSFKRFALS